MCASSAWTGASPHINKSELMCKKVCGYYGNPAWDGYCSKCFKELSNKKQKRPVFDPTTIRNRVSRSVSDVTEFPSKATSLVSRKLDRQQLQLGKRTKIVKDIFRLSHTNKGDSSLLPQLSVESQAAYNELQSLLKTFCEDANGGISKRINFFIEKISKVGSTTAVDDLGEIFHEFYSTLDTFITTNSFVWKLQDEDIFTLKDLTEKYVTTRLFNILSMNVQAYCEEKDLSLQERIRSLMWVTCNHLECKFDETHEENQNFFDEIINVLIEIDSRRTPSGKLSYLVSASNQILFLLKKSCSGTLASADDFLPALIYCILKANPPLLQSNICYITNFALESSLQTGEAGYFFTNLCCAVSFIEKLTAESLSLSDVEFDHFMSGNSLPANALQESYMSDAFRVMEQNLENMSNLEKRMESVLGGYDKMVVDIDEFKNNISSEIKSAIERSPLTIRPRKANIDESLPIEELLPPPLEPQTITDESDALDSCWSFPNTSVFSVDDVSHSEDNNQIKISSRDNDRLPQTDSTSLNTDPSALECHTVSTSYAELPRKHKKCTSLEDLFNGMTSLDLQTSKPMNYSALTSFTLQGETIKSIPCSTGLSSESPDLFSHVQKTSYDSFSPIQHPTSDPFPLIQTITSDPFYQQKTSSETFSNSSNNLPSYNFSSSTPSSNLPPPLLPFDSTPFYKESVSKFDTENLKDKTP